MATALSTTMVPLQKPLRDTPYDQHVFLEQLTAAMETMRFHPHARQQIPRTFEALGRALESCQGVTLQERWQDFEQRIWPQWLAGQSRPPGKWWTGGVRVAVTARLVRPGWDLLCTSNTATWMKYVPEEDPLRQQVALLQETLASLSWARPEMRAAALNAGLRLLLAHGYDRLHQITEQNLLDMPSAAEQGSKDRQVPFPLSFRELLALHIQQMREKGAMYLFESSRRHRYTDRGVRKMLARYAAQAGITRSMSPHKWRHFLFTWLKKEGIDDALIQPYSGHASRQSLETYSKLSLSDAQPSYNQAMERFPIH